MNEQDHAACCPNIKSEHHFGWLAPSSGWASTETYINTVYSEQSANLSIIVICFEGYARVWSTQSEVARSDLLFVISECAMDLNPAVRPKDACGWP